MADKIYCGSAKEKTFDGGGSVISVSLTMDGLSDHFKNYVFTTNGGKKIIKLKISKRREVGAYGETHTVEIDTWKPDPNHAAGPAQKPAPADDDIPF